MKVSIVSLVVLVCMLCVSQVWATTTTIKGIPTDQEVAEASAFLDGLAKSAASTPAAATPIEFVQPEIADAPQLPTEQPVPSPELSQPIEAEIIGGGGRIEDEEDQPVVLEGSIGVDPIPSSLPSTQPAEPSTLPIHPVGPERPQIHPVGPEQPQPQIHPIGPEVPSSPDDEEENEGEEEEPVIDASRETSNDLPSSSFDAPMPNFFRGFFSSLFGPHDLNASPSSMMLGGDSDDDDSVQTETREIPGGFMMIRKFVKHSPNGDAFVQGEESSSQQEFNSFDAPTNNPMPQVDGMPLPPPPHFFRRFLDRFLGPPPPPMLARGMFDSNEESPFLKVQPHIRMMVLPSGDDSTPKPGCKKHSRSPLLARLRSLFGGHDQSDLMPPPMPMMIREDSSDFPGFPRMPPPHVFFDGLRHRLNHAQEHDSEDEDEHHGPDSHDGPFHMRFNMRFHGPPMDGEEEDHDENSPTEINTPTGSPSSSPSNVMPPHPTPMLDRLPRGAFPSRVTSNDASVPSSPPSNPQPQPGDDGPTDDNMPPPPPSPPSDNQGGSGDDYPPPPPENTDENMPGPHHGGGHGIGGWIHHHPFITGAIGLVVLSLLIATIVLCVRRRRRRLAAAKLSLANSGPSVNGGSTGVILAPPSATPFSRDISHMHQVAAPAPAYNPYAPQAIEVQAYRVQLERPLLQGY